MAFFTDIDPTTGEVSLIPNYYADEAVSEASESEDEDGFGVNRVGSVGLKVESVEGFLFHDVQGVRIFEKDVIHKML